MLRGPDQWLSYIDSLDPATARRRRQVLQAVLAEHGEATEVPRPPPAWNSLWRTILLECVKAEAKRLYAAKHSKRSYAEAGQFYEVSMTKKQRLTDEEDVQAGDRLTTTTPIDPAAEYKWVVKSLFEKQFPFKRGAHIKAKGPDGFFHTIATCSDARVRRAWQLSCGDDNETINNALQKKKAQLPPAFVTTWNDAVFEVFRCRFKAETQLKNNKKQNNKNENLPNIKCLHLYQIVLKP